MSREVYVLFYQVDYDGTSPVAAFEKFEDALELKAKCDQHLSERPRCDTNLEGEEWDAEMAKQKAWAERSPIGDKFSICIDSYYVQPIEVRP